MSDNARLLEAIRSEAKPGIWSTGVNLSRAGAVALQSETSGELELRVRAAGRVVPVTVVLYPKDEAWECDCPSRVDPCEHVVAAAIAVQHAAKDTAPLKRAEERWTRVAYRFSRVDGGLAVHRTLLQQDGSEKALEGTLAALLAQPGQSAQVQVEQADLNADRLLERPLRGALPPERLDALLRVLVHARTVLLDGKPV